MTSQPEHPRCSLALHKKVLQYSPSIEQGRSPILQTVGRIIKTSLIRKCSRPEEQIIRDNVKACILYIF